ncbi:MAG: ABC transporter permease [Bryobacteraceae bacterium]|nr:ABC transporter permease [Bryobacteraceae bacterium]
MLSDFRYAFRTLRQSPLFALVAILSLALGIGANTAIYSLMDHYLLRPLPVERPHELVQLDETGVNRGFRAGDRTLSYPMFRDLRARTKTLSGLIASYEGDLSFSEGRQTDRVRSAIVSGNYFEVLGIRPVIGRLFTMDDEKTIGGHPLVVLSYGFWMSRFGGAADVLNRKVLVNGQPMQVIGVAERGFSGLQPTRSTEVFAPVMMKRQLTPTWDELENRRALWLHVFGRRAPGVSIDQAKAELNAIFAPINQAEFDAMNDTNARMRERWLQKRLKVDDASRGAVDGREGLERPVFALMAMVALVLLIACANLANLLLARSAARRKEIAVRLALGASRGRVIRQLLVESALLGLIGGLAGLLVATWTIDAMAASFATSGDRLPQWIDGPVMLFNLGLSLATALLFGLAPAFAATKPEVAPTLKDQAANTSAAGGQVRFRKALIAAQVALSLLLLAGAGLFARTLFNLRSVDPGFRTESLVQFAVDPSLNGYPNARTLDFYARLQDGLRSVPGVTAASLSDLLVLDESISQRTVSVEGYQRREDEDTNPLVLEVSPKFFETLGITRLQGRDFTERDAIGAPLVAVVNETFAKYFFKDENPLGRRFRFGRRGEPFREIVGVVKDSKHGKLNEKTWRTVYLPLAQNDAQGGMNGYVRANMDPAAIGALIRREVSKLDANLPVTQIRTVERQIDQLLTNERMVAVLSSAFGLLATALAAVGLYGVMAFIVSRRTREIGIRVALGAERGNVLWLVMREVALMTGIGLATGIPLALAAGRLIESQLFGVKPYDALVLTGAALALSIAAALAGYFPARRALSIDPVTALRYE